MTESQDSLRQPTFIHLESQLVEPPDRTSHTSGQSDASAQTWNYTSHQPSREPPPIVIPHPPVDPVPREPAEFGAIDDEEYMNIDPDGLDLGYQVVSPSSSKFSLGHRGFVGGFVHGLRKLPKAMRGGRRLQRKQASHNTIDTGGSGDTALPRYQTTDQAGPSNVRYVEATQMPVEEPAPPPIHHSHHSAPSTAADRHPGTHTPGSRVHSGQVAASHDLCNGESTVPRTNLTASLNQAAIDSPVLIQPLRSSDYARMNPSARRVSGFSFPAQVFNFHRFFRDLKELPWVSTRITTDYVPGEGDQRHVGKTIIKSSASWYKHPHNSLDLLSSGSSSSSTPPRSPDSHRSHQRTVSPSNSYPCIHPPNRRAGRHHRARTRSHDILRAPYSDGHHYPLYPFPYPPHNYSPQPLFVMQPPGSRSNTPQGDAPQPPVFPEIRQAVPVYMVSPTPSPLHEPVRDSDRDRASAPRYPTFHPFPMPVPSHPVPEQTS